MLETIQLKDLRTHCNNLAKFLYHLDIKQDDTQWSESAEWLEVASGIKKISFDMGSFNKDYGFCGFADDYTNQRDNLLELYVTEIGIFNFIWGSLEAIIDIINPPNIPNLRGKINKSCNFISQNFHNHMPCYLDLTSLLYKSLNDIFGDVSEQFEIKPHVNISGIALFAIYKVRNRLAHGALQFPYVDETDDSIGENNKVELIQLCSRLVLLSIQMLLISFLKNTEFVFKFDFLGEIELGDPDVTDKTISLDSLLRSIHLIHDDDHDDPNQMEFNFNL